MPHSNYQICKKNSTNLSPCPCCGGRCITWLKHDVSFIVACVKCRYHMGPYTRASDARRAHNQSKINKIRAKRK